MTKLYVVKLKEDQEVGIQSHKAVKDYEKEKGKREKKLAKAIERLEKKKDTKVKFKDHMLKGKYQIIETDLTLEELQADPDIESVQADAPLSFMAQDIHWGHGSDYTGTKMVYHANGLTGAGIKVAVVDSGINYEHEDLVGKVKGGAKIRDGVVISRNVPADYKDNPSVGHGTKVASALASSDNGVGTLGSAPGVDLYSYNVADVAEGISLFDVSMAVEMAVDAGMHVINISIGGPFDVPVWNDVCEYAYQNNVSVVVSAGNDPTWVSAMANAIGVLAIGAAHNNPFEIASYSAGSEPGVTFVGPSKFRTATADGNNTYADDVIGTSFASPFVAGIVAIIRQKFPNISVDVIKEKLKGTATKIADNDPHRTGHGFVRPITDTLPRRLTIEDFEDENYQVVLKGDWFRTANGTTYALTNKVIGDFAVSSSKFHVLAGDNASLRFKYLCSTQADKDFFRIYLNGAVQLKTSGQLGSNWITFDLPVVAGLNEIELRYTKDTAGTAGKDRVLIDSIELIGPVRFW